MIYGRTEFVGSSLGYARFNVVRVQRFTPQIQGGRGLRGNNL